MATLIDTNILLRTVQPSHPMHQVAVRALEVLLTTDEPLCLTIQNVAEFWNAATRPLSSNGLGYSHEKAKEEIDRLEGFFEILSESPASYAVWESL
jgi:predicted nucleic acid-binding protein